MLVVFPIDGSSSVIAFIDAVDVVEPTVPFSLAILITNAGYGSANNLRITSGQPEIIDNEKGLLVSFKIIGANLVHDPSRGHSPSRSATYDHRRRPSHGG